MFAYAALLFIVLTPGVLLRLPMKGSKMTVALTHGVVFAVVWHFTQNMVWRFAYEGFQNSGSGSSAVNSDPAVIAARAAVAAAQREVQIARENVTQAERTRQLANQGLTLLTQTLNTKRSALTAAQRALTEAVQAARRRIQLANQAALRERAA